MNTSEARKAVANLMQSDDIVSAVRDYVFSSSADVDELKIGYYALLAEPIANGITEFVKYTHLNLNIQPDLTFTQIADLVGEEVFSSVWFNLCKDFKTFTLALDISGVRAIRAKTRAMANMVAPLDKSLKSASISSARSMVDAIETNIRGLQRTKDVPFEEQVRIVRQSHHLALATPLTHLEDMPIVGMIMQTFNKRMESNRGYPDRVVVYSDKLDRLVLGMPLQEWRLGPTLQIKDCSDRHAEVRTGCPFSFSEKDLRVAYYEAIVNLVAEYGRWPRNEN